MAEKEEDKVIKTLEEDDEFEDFPEDSNWSNDSNLQQNSAHLWEEDWDDDDAKDEFSDKLREELKKAQK
ncbi:CIC11C00000000102 [Sungouiella intermedia]|uniref:26S proteasome complex subunit SEM1 n=1 Tax=Sungouiella intermedia TaxID=45354 RepID=A0A1L0G0P2_9ASCO|nr:CIC11C00000000102 [[Candida] intermedia]